jgi:hypothetical protein
MYFVVINQPLEGLAILRLTMAVHYLSGQLKVAWNLANLLSVSLRCDRSLPQIVWIICGIHFKR